MPIFYVILIKAAQYFFKFVQNRHTDFIIVFNTQLKDCEVMDSRLGRDEGGDNHHTEVIIGGMNEDRLQKVILIACFNQN